MKKLLFNGLLIGLTASAFAQGQIALDNYGNSNPSLAATTGGLFFLDGVLITGDFNAAFYGGPDANSLVLLHSFSGVAKVSSGAAGPGTWTDPTASNYVVPNATTTAVIKIEAWTGAFSSYASALAGGAHVATATFSNPVALPPGTPPDLTGMPAICMCVPEPGTFALAALGAAALLIFRRRK